MPPMGAAGYRLHFPLTSELFASLFSRLNDQPTSARTHKATPEQFVDIFFDLPSHLPSLLFDVKTRQDWPGGRWLRCRVERRTGLNSWRLRSCFTTTTNNQHVEYRDLGDEEQILATLFPEYKSRPRSLLNTELVMYARIPTARLTIDHPSGAKVLLECAMLAPDQYALQGTIVASQLRHLQEVRETLAAVDWLATLPVESKVVKSLQLRHPAFYQKLCSHGVVPQETDSFHDWHLHPRSPLTSASHRPLHGSTGATVRAGAGRSRLKPCVCI